MRSIKILFGCFALWTIVGCGDGAHEFNRSLVELRDRPSKAMADVISMIQTYDGSDAQAKAIDDAYASLLKSIGTVKADLAAVEVPSGIDQSQEMYDAVIAFMNEIEAMLAEDWGKIIPLIKKAKKAQGVERADVYADLRLLAGKLQARSHAADEAMRNAQSEFAKVNKMRLEN